MTLSSPSSEHGYGGGGHGHHGGGGPRYIWRNHSQFGEVLVPDGRGRIANMRTDDGSSQNHISTAREEIELYKRRLEEQRAKYKIEYGQVYEFLRKHAVKVRPRTDDRERNQADGDPYWRMWMRPYAQVDGTKGKKGFYDAKGMIDSVPPEYISRYGQYNEMGRLIYVGPMADFGWYLIKDDWEVADKIEQEIDEDKTGLIKGGPKKGAPFP